MAFLCCWRRTRARSVQVLAGTSPDRQRSQPQALSVPLTVKGVGRSPDKQCGQPQASPVPLTVKGAGSSPDRQHGQAYASPVSLTANGADCSSDRQHTQPQASSVPMTANVAGNSAGRQHNQSQASLLSLTVNGADRKCDQPHASPVPLTVNAADNSSNRQHDQPQESPVPLVANVERARYTLAELNRATNNFHQNIGFGGFGKVYRGVLSDGTKVAVKRRDPKSLQGLKEFRAEIDICIGLHHPHLVCLLGYCDEGGEMMLVYEYMEEGTLASHLYGNRSRLRWEQRLKILIEAATGLHYLHTCSEKGIVHRDMKSANILLDEKLVGKISDFGLVRMGPELGRSHVTTEVKGTPGFLDLEYLKTKHLTFESDVYGFGVIMLVTLCGRKAFDLVLPDEEMILATWGLKKIKKGRLQEIVDQSILHTIRPECLKEIGKIVKKCLAESHKDRPSMKEVISELKAAQKLQYVLSNSMPAGSHDISSPVSSGPCSPPCPLSDFDSDSYSSDSPTTIRSKRPGALPKYRLHND